MATILQSDIFFFITSIAVIVFTIFFIIIGLHFVKIMKNFSHISDTLRKAVDNTDQELRDMSEHVRESPIFTFIFGKRKKEKAKK